MTKNRSVEVVDPPRIVVPTGPSTTTSAHAHLPAVDADGVVRPICEQGSRGDREWELRTRETAPLGADEICIGCDPERQRETRTMDFSYQDALKREAERNEEVAD
jgi:hypothetical protein